MLMVCWAAYYGLTLESGAMYWFIGVRNSDGIGIAEHK